MVTDAQRITTVRLLAETWRRLNARRIVPSENLDEVVKRLLDETERESAGKAK